LNWRRYKKQPNTSRPLLTTQQDTWTGKQPRSASPSWVHAALRTVCQNYRSENVLYRE